MPLRTVIQNGVTFRVDSEIGWVAGTSASVAAIKAPLSHITTGHEGEEVDAFLLTAPLLIFSGAVTPIAGPAQEIANWQLGIAQNVTAYQRVASYTSEWTVTEAFQTDSRWRLPPLRDGEPSGIPFYTNGAALRPGQRTDIDLASSPDAPRWGIPRAVSSGSTLVSTSGDNQFATWLMLARVVDPPEERKIILLGQILWRVDWTTVMQGAAPVFQGPVTTLLRFSPGLGQVFTANLPALGNGDAVPDLRTVQGNDYVFGTLDHKGEVRRWCNGEDGAAEPFVQQADPNLSPNWLTQGGQVKSSGSAGSARPVVPANAVASGQGTVFALEVAAKIVRVDTGLMVEEDLRVSLRPTSGSWTANPSTDMVGAAGHPGLIARDSYALPGALEGLLVGHVDARVFSIGDGAAVPDGEAGRLSLGINDDVSGKYGDGFADNEGSLRVEIIVAGGGAGADGARSARSEAIARSLAKLRLVASGPQLRQAKNPLGELPKSQWWKLFIDRGAQDPTQSNAQNALRFDRESSPGYYAAMMHAYEQVLAPAEEGLRSRLQPEDLIDDHHMVTEGTLSRDDQTFVPTPDALSGKGTTFPMTRREGDLPSAVAFEEMAKSEIIGLLPAAQLSYHSAIVDSDTPEQRYLKRATAESPGGSMTLLRPLSTYLIDTNYDQQDAAAIMDMLLDTYYTALEQADQIQGPAQDEEKLRTIVTLIRALHTAHLFTDANGRLNTMVLLNQFLIEEGFDPVILDDTSVFGGGFSIDQLVGQVKRGMNTFSQEARGRTPWGTVKRSYAWFSYAEDDDPGDARVQLLYVIRLDLAKVPDKHRGKVATAITKFQDRAFPTTQPSAAIEALGFKQSMDAMLLENELETLTRD
jgi:hypothetical protein